MGLTGQQFSSYIESVFLPRVLNVIYWNTWWKKQNIIAEVPQSECPTGTAAHMMIDYSETNNAELYARGAPMPSAGGVNAVEAYWNYDYFQNSAKVYGDELSQTRGGTMGLLSGLVDVAVAQAVANGGMSREQGLTAKAIATAVVQIIDLMSTTFITDLAAQVDSSTAFSDASLTRATYGIASYESALGGALTQAALEDMLEAVQNTTYGIVPIEDLFWVCARNQKTNLSRLNVGAAYHEISYSATEPGGDAGRIMRTTSYEDAPILVIEELTNTEWYLLRKSATKILMHEPIKVTFKDPDEWAESWLVTGGANLVITDPLRCGKTTGVTA